MQVTVLCGYVIAVQIPIELQYSRQCNSSLRECYFSINVLIFPHTLYRILEYNLMSSSCYPSLNDLKVLEICEYRA